MVAIVILAILTVGSVQFLASNRNEIQVAETNIQQIISLLREARTRAIAGSSDTGDAGGFGVFFDATNQEALVFADKDPSNGIYEPALSADGDPISDIVSITDNVILEVYDSATPAESDTSLLEDDGNPQNFTVTFALDSADVMFWSEQSGGALTTSDILLRITLPEVRQYDVAINKISRFFDTTVTQL